MNSTNDMRNKYNGMNTNYTGIRSLYELVDKTGIKKEVIVSAIVSLDNQKRIQVKITDENLKAMLNRTFKKKVIGQKNTEKYAYIKNNGGFEISARRTKTHRKKGRRRRTRFL